MRLQHVSDALIPLQRLGSVLSNHEPSDYKRTAFLEQVREWSREDIDYVRRTLPQARASLHHRLGVANAKRRAIVYNTMAMYESGQQAGKTVEARLKSASEQLQSLHKAPPPYTAQPSIALDDGDWSDSETEETTLADAPGVYSTMESWHCPICEEEITSPTSDLVS